MNISEGFKKEFADEISYVITKMREVKRPVEKIYYFTAVHGMALRIINIEYDPELSFVHQTLNYVYATINSRLTMFAMGQEAVVTLPEELFDKLEEYLSELMVKIQTGKNTHAVLQKMCNLAYSTTGNGYYLYEKGILKFE